MSKEQIEEMAKDICRLDCSCEECLHSKYSKSSDKCAARRYAERAYKKNFVMLVVVLLTLTGCKNQKGQTFNEFLNKEYPNLQYRNSSYNFDSDNRKIEIPDGYVLNQGDSFEWVETEDGYNLIIHFIKGGAE